MSGQPAQRVEMIPIERILVLNPRVRSKHSAEEMRENIAQLGLKKPITVTRRDGDGDPFFDLVCGQGRLEAYMALAQTEVPALVVSADPEDCLIASLVENCARRKHQAIDLLYDIRGMQQRGFSSSEIARKTGLSLEYVSGVARLIGKGEQRLLRSVEAGTIPISVAIDIAEADDHDVQTALSSAYEKGLLKGRKLLAAKKLVETRRRRGKGLASTSISPRTRQPMSAAALVKIYQEDTDRKRAMIRRAGATRSRLVFIIEALRKLRRDDRFINILKHEGIDTVPENI
ncbi:MAG: chromosome partitioning protein ParB, partial [Hyphomicrobiales bacterium]